MTQSSAPTQDGFWDQAYSRGEHRQHWEPQRVPRELIEALRTGLVSEGQRALDIGCGSGVEAVFLAVEGVTVVGVDSSPVALEIARLRAERAGVTVDWRCGFVERLPLADNSIDFALDRGCFHALDRRRRRLYAKQLSRALCPGGALLLRGAREDDEEAGLLGCGRGAVERIFGPRGFVIEESRPLTMAARSGDLPAVLVVLRWVAQGST